ncbi:MAG: Y-family DNA polymerase, partial [Rhodanobacteraceae bacterium]
MLWACVLLPSLALDTALRGRAPSDRPFALVTGSAQQRRLIAVDAHARAAGLAPGQRLAEAEAVCQNLLTAEYDPDCTRASLALIAAWAYRYSSEVLVDPPRAVILEVERSFGLFGAWPAIEARLRGELAQLGFRHRIALAPTPRAARVLARVRDGMAVIPFPLHESQKHRHSGAIAGFIGDGTRNPASHALTPRAGFRVLPADSAGSPGMTTTLGKMRHCRTGNGITSTGDLSQALAPIPIARAGLPAEAAATLAGMGIRTLGAVLALPRAALQRRFGKALVEAIELLLGSRPDTLAAYRPPDRFDARIEFGFEVKHHQGLLFPLRRMLGDLAAYLAARDGGVQRFTIRFVHTDAAPTDLAIGLLAPEREASALFEVAKLRLEQTTLPAPVLELEIHADALPPFVPEGADLLDTRAANALPWPQLVDRLRARLGGDAVYDLRADPDPRPERAWAHSGDSTPDESIALPTRPTWLLPRPIPLRG